MKFLANTVKCVLIIAFSVCHSISVVADVILTFQQNNVVENSGVAIDQSYGDNVTLSPDGNGHQYGLTTGINGAGAPDVTVQYYGSNPKVWENDGTGYGGLDYAFYIGTGNAIEFGVILKISNTSDQLMLHSFDLGSYGSNLTLTRIEVSTLDTILFSQDNVALSSSTPNHFDIADFGTLPSTDSSRDLNIRIVTTGMGSSSDSVGISNIQFAQVVPEPGTFALIGLGVAAIALRRRAVRA